MRVRAGAREKRLLSTHRHFRYRCMRARAREERVRERRAGGMGMEVRRGRKGKEMSFSLARGAGKGPFSEKRSCVSLPETVLFFYKFRRPRRRRESRRVRAARFRPFVNELTAAVRTQGHPSLERDCSLHRVILPRRLLASAEM